MISQPSMSPSCMDYRAEPRGGWRAEAMTAAAGAGKSSEAMPPRVEAIRGSLTPLRVRCMLRLFQVTDRHRLCSARRLSCPAAYLHRGAQDEQCDSRPVVPFIGAPGILD